MNYKLNNDEFETLKRWSDAMRNHAEISKSFEAKITVFIQTVAAPKSGQKMIEGTVSEVSINWDKREVEFGLAKPVAGSNLVIPKGGGRAT